MSVKAFADLTPSGRLRRLRGIAHEALAAYGFGRSEISLLTHHENVTFSVRRPPAGDRYLLRIHRPGYQTAESIESELHWLRALAEDGALVVPRPVTANDARVVAVGRNANAAPFLCSLLRWVPGRRMLRKQRPEHYRQLGRVTAMLHEHARSWTRPPGFTRPTWNTEGLLGHRPNLVDVAIDNAWALVPPKYRPILDEVAARFTDATDRLGRSPDAFGLIHSDLHLENVIFAGGSARPIDFDDCGFGWFVYDLAAAPQLFAPFPDAAVHRAAFLAGYHEIRPFDDARLRFLGVMRAARLAGLGIWLIHRALDHAAIRTALGGWLESGTQQIKSLLKERP